MSRASLEIRLQANRCTLQRVRFLPKPLHIRLDHPPEKRAETKEALRPDQHLTAKHTLLATAANQNYQRYYKALKVLETYWAGRRYMLTALDQKSKGIMDPLLFTLEGIDSEMPSTEPSFTTPG